MKLSTLTSCAKSASAWSLSRKNAVSARIVSVRTVSVSGSDMSNFNTWKVTQMPIKQNVQLVKLHTKALHYTDICATSWVKWNFRAHNVVKRVLQRARNSIMPIWMFTWEMNVLTLVCLVHSDAANKQFKVKNRQFSAEVSRWSSTWKNAQIWLWLA